MATLFAWLKSIPAIVKIVNTFIDTWYNVADANTDAHFEELAAKIRARAKRTETLNSNQGRIDELRKNHPDITP